MIDFTSALYLGIHHSSRALRPWGHLTTGAPAALLQPANSLRIADKLALLIGCESATLAPSTLHLFFDIFKILSKQKVTIYLDAGAYPIAKWGIEHAKTAGIPVHIFPHYNVGALKKGLRSDCASKRHPIVVTDGFCPRTGTPAPIRSYLGAVRAFGGLLIIDDTQSLGILGHSPNRDLPYGKGGGGILRWSDVRGSEMIVVSSLAKGLGVPMAVMAGSQNVIKIFKEKSDTRLHCSPPSTADLHAAEHALSVNDAYGDALRYRLAKRIYYFRRRLAEISFSTAGGLFPFQTLRLSPKIDASILYKNLLRLGIRGVLLQGSHGRPRIGFLLTTRHGLHEVDAVTNTLAQTVVRLNIF